MVYPLTMMLAIGFLICRGYDLERCFFCPQCFQSFYYQGICILSKADSSSSGTVTYKVGIRLKAKDNPCGGESSVGIEHDCSLSYSAGSKSQVLQYSLPGSQTLAIPLGGFQESGSNTGPSPTRSFLATTTCIDSGSDHVSTSLTTVHGSDSRFLPSSLKQF